MRSNTRQRIIATYAIGTAVAAVTTWCASMFGDLPPCGPRGLSDFERCTHGDDTLLRALLFCAAGAWLLTNGIACTLYVTSVGHRQLTSSQKVLRTTAFATMSIGLAALGSFILMLAYVGSKLS